jgi:cell division protein ZipA
MVIIGTLLIVAVFIDAWRRIRNDRRETVRLKIASVGDDGEDIDDIVTMRELPNGGARVLKREDLIAARRQHDAEQAAERADSDSAGRTELARAEGATEGAIEGAAEGAAGDAAAGEEPSTEPKPARGTKKSRRKSGAEQPLAGVRPDRSEPANLDWLEDLPAESDGPAEDDAGALPRSEDMEVIVLHVVTHDEAGFDGGAILEILLACDLRFGDMDFFHRHEREAGRGPIQFSVANMLKPGVFDIDHMADMRTRGLVFFLTLPGPEDMVKAFDYMLETARTVARNLGGEVLDESLSALTEQSIEHARQRIRDLERRMLAPSA